MEKKPTNPTEETRSKYLEQKVRNGSLYLVRRFGMEFQFDTCQAPTRERVLAEVKRLGGWITSASGLRHGGRYYERYRVCIPNDRLISMAHERWTFKD